MKFFIIIMLFHVAIATAQDPNSYLKNFDNKVYSLKTKGVKDFVVDIESTRLTKQVNDQAIFGKVKNLVFKVYWTASPERISIVISGLPDGFKEIKEDLKQSILALMDNLIPIPMEQRFKGYKFSFGTKPKEILAQDLTNISPIPSFTLKFDQQDRLVEIVGNRPIGTLNIKSSYEKKDFSDGKWVLGATVITNSESGQIITTKNNLSYGVSQGISVLSTITVSTEQRGELLGSKPVVIEDVVTLTDYKINSGEALTHFLGNKANSNTK